MTLPNFLCIGVQRGATTWLHKCLQSHPEVFLPNEKELHFFNHNFERGLGWYESHFQTAGDAKAIGEITPNYLHTAPLERIRQTLPDVRLIVIRREALSRAYSAYRLLNEKFGEMNFEQACESESGEYLVKQSLYADRLEELYSLFPRERIMIQLFDDVNRAPAKVFSEVCEFLEVEAIETPAEVNQTFNHILYPAAQAFFGKLKLTWVVECIKRTPLGDAIKRMSKRKQ